MLYKKIKIDVKEEKADLLIGLLLDFNITSYEIIDNKPEENPFDFDYEELKPNLPEFNGIDSFIVYFNENDDTKVFIDEIQKAIPDITVFISASDELDWRDKWKNYFHPFTIGDIVIKPSWEEYEDDKKMVVEIDPGVSFGTGSHETTKMCIESLSKKSLNEKIVLDAGCGSGILSIVSNKLGAKKTVCLDIDSVCIDTTKENLEKNNCNLDEFEFYVGNIVEDKTLNENLKDESVDVVVANILADIITAMLPNLVKKIKSNGYIITSGIIEGKEDKVIGSFKECGLTVTNTKKDGEWFMVEGIKNGK